MQGNDRKPTGAGKSSYDLINVDTFFDELDLQKGISFLDLACGRGAYCLAASEIIGKNGLVYGLDLWEEGIKLLKAEAADRGLNRPVKQECVSLPVVMSLAIC